MRELLMRLIRYKGEYVVLGRNQAMRMLLNQVEQPQGWPMHSRPVYVGGVVSPIYSQDACNAAINRQWDKAAQLQFPDQYPSHSSSH